MIRRAGLGLALVAAIAALAVPGRARAADLLVFAAASLKDALDDIVGAFAKTAVPVKVSYAASSTLAKQIEHGAPADFFISADLDWMDYLAQRELIAAATRTNLLGNTLVLVAPADSTTTLKIGPHFPLAAALGGGRLVTGDPAHVPVGLYAKAALQKLGVWDDVASRLAPADSVRAALLLVARREAPLGIVYRTDALAEPRVKVIATFPADSHPPIVYPAAITAESKNPSSAALLAFLKSSAARQIFERHGFALLAALPNP